MNILNIARYVVGVILAVAMLGGCSAFIEPQERALINIIHAYQNPDKAP